MNLLPEYSLTRLNEIHHCDALTLLNALSTESVGLVVTSPPYNLKNSTGNGMKSGKSSLWKNAALRDGYTDHDDNMPHEQYVQWQRSILDECMRVLKSNGAIFYNHKWRVQGGLLQDRSDILQGLPVRQIIIWYRGSSMNFNQAFFAPTYEVIYLIAKPDFKLAKGATGMGDMWHIQPEDSSNPHPAPFPVALAERCIMSTDAQLILDPFMGSGTTAVAAKKLQRQFIGCDKSLKYVEDARRRIAQPVTLPMFAA